MRILLILLLSGVVSACAGKQEGLRPLSSAQIQTGMTVDAPRGFAEMCARDPVLCERGASTATDSEADSRAEFRLAGKINGLVNRRVRQRSDLDTFGSAEFWSPSGIAKGAQGDCEDIALEKRNLLLQAGFDPARLSLAVVYHRRVGLHTVLVARIEGRDLVLDSREPRVRIWHKTPYVWVSLEQADEPLQVTSLPQWAMVIDPRNLNDPQADVATAAGAARLSRRY
jgi:predicted transglutaminase-like cysteine proteinase